MAGLPVRLQAGLGDRYRIGDQIGTGGTAVVFLADDLKLQRTVALKVLRPDRVVDVMTDRFLEEIRLVAPLSHPNILPLYESGMVDDLLYFVMPYVAGGTVRQLLDHGGPLQVERVLSISNDVARGLDYAHSQNVIHRDIKPENILLEGGQARLADFGVALALRRSEPRLSVEGLVVGTPHYMSPEQCAGVSVVGPASDVYSLGCVVYEMLAGEPPFTGSSARSICGRHMNSHPPDLRILRPTVTEQLNRVMQAALAKVPSDRPQTAGTFVEQLTTASHPPVPSVTRSSMFQFAILFMGMLVAVVLGRWSWGGNESADRAQSSYALTEAGVRPFVVDASTSEWNWLGSALATEVTHGLAEVPTMSVVRPTAFQAYPVELFPIDTVSRLFGIGTIVDGRVTVLEDSIRIAVSLSETASHRQLGSPVRVAVPRGEEWRLAQRIVYDIVSEIRRVLGRELEQSEWRQEAPSNEAWQAVWRAGALRDEARRMGRDTATIGASHRLLDDADGRLRRASEHAPDWLTPTLLMAWIDADRVWLAENAPRVEVDSSEVRRWIDRGLGEVNEVLQRERDHARARELRGVLLIRKWHWAASPALDLLADAQRDLELAVERDEGLALAWLTLGTVYKRRGDFAAAAQATQRARAADAWLEEVAGSVAREQFDAMRERDVTTAAAACEFGKRHYPTDPLFIKCDLDVLGWFANEADDVARAWRRIDEIETHLRASALADQAAYRRSLVAAIAARAGMHDSARSILRRARPTGGSGGRHWLFQRAWVELLLGDTALSIESIERYLAAEPARRDYVREHPWFETLRQSATFQRVTSPTELDPVPR
jgi:serine/threonine-protein kinase